MSSSVKLYADRRERESNLKERKEKDRVKVSYNFRWLQSERLRVWHVACLLNSVRLKSFVALLHVAFLKQHFPHERFWTNIAFHSIERMLFPGNLRSNDSLEDILRALSPWFEVVQSKWLQIIEALVQQVLKSVKIFVHCTFVILATLEFEFLSKVHDCL